MIFQEPTVGISGSGRDVLKHSLAQLGTGSLVQALDQLPRRLLQLTTRARHTRLLNMEKYTAEHAHIVKPYLISHGFLWVCPSHKFNFEIPAKNYFLLLLWVIPIYGHSLHFNAKSENFSIMSSQSYWCIISHVCRCNYNTQFDPRLITRDTWPVID